MMILKQPPKQERGQRKVQAILEAANTILDEDGVDAVTTRNIATRSGIPVGSIYQFFNNRRDILLALAEQVLNHNDAQLLDLFTRLGGELNLSVRTRTFVEAVFNSYDLPPNTLALLAQARSWPEWRQLWQASNRSCHNVVMTSIRAQRDDLTPDHLELIVNILIEATSAIVESAIGCPADYRRRLKEEAVLFCTSYLRHYMSERLRPAAILAG